jgi:hypothetical protein
MDRREAVQLRAAKEAKRQDLKLARDNEISLPINNVQVATLTDRENITGAIDLMTATGTEEMAWVLLDNTVEMFSIEDLQGCKDTYVMRKAQAFVKYGLMLGQLSHAETVADVSAITWQ